MHKSTLPEGLRVLKKHIEKGTLRFDLPFQRADHQWSQLQKSLLIHSMLGDYPIPPLYFVKDKEEGKIVHQTLEGQQRLTSLCEFINGDFKLHASTPPVIIEGNTIDLANMTFNELSVEVKDMILGYHFTIYVIEDATEEELEEIFAD